MVQIKEKKLVNYIVKFSTKDGGFGGWNGCHAVNLRDAQKQLKEKLGLKLYGQISEWLIGKKADKAEPGLLSLFW